MNESDKTKAMPDTWSRIGRLRHLMTAKQALAVLGVIGQSYPAMVAVHDCGIVRIVVNDKTTYINKDGHHSSTKVARESMTTYEANKPKRGRPRKAK